jgi:hypothetical protein
MKNTHPASNFARYRASRQKKKASDTKKKKKRWQVRRKKNVRNPAAYMNEEHMPSIGFTRSRYTKKEGKKREE